MAFTFVARRGVALWCVGNDGARMSTSQVFGVRLSTIGERLRQERDRLGLNQTAFAEVGGVQKRAQINYEKDERYPDAGYLAAIAAAGVDVLYVLTGQRSQSVTEQSNSPLTANLTETAEPVTPPSAVPQIDAERLARIVDLLERFAAQAGKRWPAKRLVVLAAEVYNVLADEPALDEPKVERILKLVVNR